MAGLTPTAFAACPNPAGELSAAPNSPSQWLELFATQVMRDESRLSSSTLEAYILDVTMLSRWAEDQGKDLLDLTTGDLSRYLGQCLEQGARPSTLARHLSSYRRFYAFLLSQGARSANPAADVHRPEVVRDGRLLLPDSVMRVLLRPPSLQSEFAASDYRARRDHTLVCMLYGTSLPISEVRLLRWQQIDAQGHVKGMPSGGGAGRRVLLDVALLAAMNGLRRCLRVADFIEANNPYCFPTASGTPMTRQGLCQVIHKWAQERGVDAIVTPSGIRQAGLARRAGRRRL